MSCTSSSSTAAAAPNPTRFFQRAITAMWNYGVDMLGRIQKVPELGSADHLPKRWRDPKRSELRLTRTLDWVLALARVLSGGRQYLQPAPPPPSAPPGPGRKPRAKPSGLQRTEEEHDEQRFLGRLRYMRKIFATQPTNVIARRLARRLGVKEGTDWWPVELLTIIETPAAWAAIAYRQPTQPQATQLPAPQQPPNLPIRGNPAPVAFYPRE